jgi:hypothetical protein
MKKPELPEANATMQIDAVGDLEGIQLDDNEAEDAGASVPPLSVGRALPPPLPALVAESQPLLAPPAQTRPSAPPAPSGQKRTVVYGAIVVVVVVGIAGGLALGSALRGKPVPVAPSAVVPRSVPVAAAPSASAAPPPAAPTVMRLDTIEVRDPPAETK